MEVYVFVKISPILPVVQQVRKMWLDNVKIVTPHLFIEVITYTMHYYRITYHFYLFIRGIVISIFRSLVLNRWCDFVIVLQAADSDCVDRVLACTQQAIPMFSVSQVHPRPLMYSCTNEITDFVCIDEYHEINPSKLLRARKRLCPYFYGTSTNVVRKKLYENFHDLYKNALWLGRFGYSYFWVQIY